MNQLRETYATPFVILNKTFCSVLIKLKILKTSPQNQFCIENMSGFEWKIEKNGNSETTIRSLDHIFKQKVLKS